MIESLLQKYKDQKKTFIIKNKKESYDIVKKLK